MTNDPCQYALSLPSLSWTLLGGSHQTSLSNTGIHGQPLSPDTVFFPSGAAGVPFCPLALTVSKPSMAFRQKRHLSQHQEAWQ